MLYILACCSKSVWYTKLTQDLHNTLQALLVEIFQAQNIQQHFTPTWQNYNHTHLVHAYFGASSNI